MLASWRCFCHDWAPVFTTEHNTDIAKLDRLFAFVHHRNLDSGRRESQLTGDFGVTGTRFDHRFDADFILDWPPSP